MTQAVKDVRKLPQEGAIDERRRLVRAFAKEIGLDPTTGQGRAHVYVLPDSSVLSPSHSATEKPAVSMVAGARYVAEKKRFRATIEFTFGPRTLQIVAIRRQLPCMSPFCA